MQLIDQFGSGRPWQADSQRFEAKYLINELQALAIKDFIGPFVVPDAHGRQYPVISVYLDCPDLRMYWSSELGEKNRYKLRIRRYSESGDHPVFFEIKHRTDQVIKKQRTAVRVDAVQSVLRGQVMDPSIMHKAYDSGGAVNLLRFRDMMEVMWATPKVVVRYDREALVSNFEEAVRITFDRHLSALSCPEYTPEIWSPRNRWRDLDRFPVILEIKFTDTFPRWVRELVWRFNLMRISLAKYVVCMKALHNAGIPLAGTGANESAWSSWGA